jgi:hypothetical protein
MLAEQINDLFEIDDSFHSKNITIEKNTDKTRAAVHRIMLHTDLAQSLWNSHWKKGRLGLIQITERISKLSRAQKADDPYAEMILLKMYKSMIDAGKTINEMEKIAQSYFDNLRGMEPVLWKAEKPKYFPLYFGNRFLRMAAPLLVGNADYVIRQIFTLDDFGVLFNQDSLTIKRVMQSVQNVLAVPMKWNPEISVTREDIRLNNDRAKLARDNFGDLPEKILNQELSHPFMPRSKNKGES